MMHNGAEYKLNSIGSNPSIKHRISGNSLPVERRVESVGIETYKVTEIKGKITGDTIVYGKTSEGGGGARVFRYKRKYRLNLPPELLSPVTIFA
jgi:hypothetical protein